MRKWPVLIPTPGGRRWLVVSAAVHAVLVGWFLAMAAEPDPEFGLGPGSRMSGTRIIEVPVFLGDLGIAASESGGEFVTDPVVEGETVRLEDTSPEEVSVTESDSVVLALGDAGEAEPSPATGTAEGAADPTGRGPRRGVRSGSRRLAPAYGDGRPWVEPRDSVAIPSNVLALLPRVDSLLVSRLRELINNLPPDSFALAGPPKWTTEAGGKTWGVDDQFIYLGDIKIPTMILALLPLDNGNYFQAKEAEELERMRQDLIQSARRQEAAADFKRYVQETRKRRDRERRERLEKLKPRVVARDTINP